MSARLVKLLAVSVLLVGAACNDLPTDPTPSSPDPKDNGRVIQEAPALRSVLDDASSRVLLALPNGPERDDLGTRLRSLDRELQVGYTKPVRTALTATRFSLTTYQSRVTDSGVAAELDAIGFALDVIDWELIALGY